MKQFEKKMIIYELINLYVNSYSTSLSPQRCTSLYTLARVVQKVLSFSMKEFESHPGNVNPFQLVLLYQHFWDSSCL